MNDNRLNVVANLWIQVLESKMWSKESAKLRRSIEQFAQEELTLKENHRLLNEIVSNSFLRVRMPELYHKHEKLLKASMASLEKTVARRKETVRALRQLYLSKQKVPVADSATIECELGASDVKEAVEDALERYANEQFSKEFDKSGLLSSMGDIWKTLESRTFVTDCLKILVADFVAEANGEAATDETIRPFLLELIGQLIEAGHDPRDLISNAKSVMLPDGRSPDVRFKEFVSKLTTIGRGFTILTGLDDLKLASAGSYKIADITLYSENQDLQILDKMPPELDEMKAFLKKRLSAKVVAEIHSVAFGNIQASEFARERIAQAIDIVSLQDPDVVIREPREERQTNEFVLNEKMELEVSVTNRVELLGKILDESACKKVDGILGVLNLLLTKPPTQLTEFEKRILAGIHYYRRGNFAFDPRDKVINYTVSLESMLVSEHPSTTLPNRVLNVNGINEDHRSKLRKLIEAAYHHRGEILHLGISDKIESERFSREMRELDRRTLGVLLNYVGKPNCETLKQFLEVLEKETLAERDQALKSALLEINKQFSGKGTIKYSNGMDIGDVDFTIGYRDDSRYVYILGSINSFKLRGSLTPATGCYIEGKLAGYAEVFHLDMLTQFDPFDLMPLLGGVGTLPFQAVGLSKS